jgi:hypothetical protein
MPNDTFGRLEDVAHTHTHHGSLGAVKEITEEQSPAHIET